MPLHAVAAKDLKTFLVKYPYLKASGFAAKEGELRLLPGKAGLSAVVLGLGKSSDALALAAFSESLPDGIYKLGEVPQFCGGAHAALAWLLGLYQFSRYKEPSQTGAKTGAATRGGWRRNQPHRRGRLSRPRPDQHAPQ